ncbi:MAG: hypothetical protein AAGJ82_12025, partial [Bacteroidota bacterium]
MQILRELIKIITKVKLRSIRKLAFPLTDEGHLATMYNLLADGVEDENSLALELTGRTERSGGYRRLKADLIDRLIATLFLVDLSQPSYNNRQRAYYELHKKWAAAKILLGKGARAAGLELSEQVFRQSMRYEFNSIALDVARHLRIFSATVVGDGKKYEYYATVCVDLEKTVQLEQLAEAEYARLIIDYYRKKVDQAARMTAAEQAYAKLVEYLTDCDSHDFHLHAGLIRLGVTTTKGNHANTIEVCDELINFFEQKTFTASVPLQILYLQKLYSHFQLRQFDAVNPFIEKGLALLQPGSYNWYNFLKTYLLLALHTEQYDTAFETFVIATEHSRFKQLTPEMKEYWRVLEAYLHYLVEQELLSSAIVKGRFTKFRLGRFLNETPEFYKDKRGMNVSILIIQILFLIMRGRYNDTVDKIDAVEQYSRRHLYREDTLRSFYFIKALLELPKNYFHKVAVQRKAGKYLEKMAQHPLETAEQVNYFTEILPFEKIWVLLVGQLS